MSFVFFESINNERRTVPFSVHVLFPGLRYSTTPLQLLVGINQYQVEPIAQTASVAYLSFIDPGHLLHEVNRVEAKPRLFIPSDCIRFFPLPSRLGLSLTASFDSLSLPSLPPVGDSVV